MLGSTCTCTPTDPLPVIDNWNAAAIFDSLILTCTPCTKWSSCIQCTCSHYNRKLWSKINSRLQFTIYAYNLPCDCPMTSHFNFYRLDIQTLFRIANYIVTDVPTKLLYSYMIMCCEPTFCYSYLFIYLRLATVAAAVTSTKVKEPELQLTVVQSTVHSKVQCLPHSSPLLWQCIVIALQP